MKALLDLDLASVPGVCPLTMYGSTLGECLGFDGKTLDPQRVSILRMYVLDRVESLLKGKLTADPIKLFIKQEPHKIEKLEEGRLRLISAVSVIDTMIDRMLFQDLFEQIIRFPLKTPIAIGWSPLGSGAAFLKSHFPGKTFDTDKRHWDWTFPWWLLADCYQILVPEEWPSWRKTLAYRRFYMLYRYAVFSFPDGSLVSQKGDGIQKSGCYLTLLLNSLGQWLLHEHAQLSLGVEVEHASFGDDVTQRSTKYDVEFLEFYRSLGFEVKPTWSDDIEFCGFHIFTNCRFLPSYKDKHVFMLRHLTMDPQIAAQTLQSYQYLYWFDKEFLALIRSIAVSRGLQHALVDDGDIMRVVMGR